MQDRETRERTCPGQTTACRKLRSSPDPTPVSVTASGNRIIALGGSRVSVTDLDTQGRRPRVYMLEQALHRPEQPGRHTTRPGGRSLTRGLCRGRGPAGRWTWASGLQGCKRTKLCVWTPGSRAFLTTVPGRSSQQRPNLYPCSLRGRPTCGRKGSCPHALRRRLPPQTTQQRVGKLRRGSTGRTADTLCPRTRESQVAKRLLFRIHRPGRNGGAAPQPCPWFCGRGRSTGPSPAGVSLRREV